MENFDNKNNEPTAAAATLSSPSLQSTPSAPAPPFTVYHEGVALKLLYPPCQISGLTRRTTPPPSSLSSLAPALRVRDITPNLLLILTADECLYKGEFIDEPQQQKSLSLQLQLQHVRDMDYCSKEQQLYIVKSDGVVVTQQLNSRASSSSSLDIDWSSHAWSPLTFDPLGLCEPEGVHIVRVCCSAHGVIFVTQQDDIYVLGSCGDLFQGETQPKHMNLGTNAPGRILNVVAGEDHFLILYQRTYCEKEDTWEVLTKAPTNNSNGGTIAAADGEGSARQLDALRVDDLQSNSSLHSYQSSSKSSGAEEDLMQDFVSRQQYLLRLGYGLLHTRVLSFGGLNNGLLGLGDHIKRPHINNIQKVEAIGVCAVAAGKEHSLVRTLDGRLYHWGLNSRQQLSSKPDCLDISTPLELKLDSELESGKIFEACCGDYKTVLGLLGGCTPFKDDKAIKQNREFLLLDLGSGGGNKGQATIRPCGSGPSLLATGPFTLYNHRDFRMQYHACLQNLQQQLAAMIKYRHAVQMLQIFQQKRSTFNMLQQICQYYQRILYILTASVWSLETYYRGDNMQHSDLIFIKYHRDFIAMFEEYTRAYCDIYSIDGFTEAEKVYRHFSSVPLMPSHMAEDTADGPSSSAPQRLQTNNNFDNLARLFQQAFHIFPIYIQFLEHLLKTQPEYREHLLAWQAMAQQNRIDLELAESTLDFWQRNDRNSKICHFRRKHRRVILTSSTVHLKLASTAISMSATTFILFSDCLCQVDRSIQTYPLITLWVKKESDTGLRIITPEKNFALTARSQHDKMLWYDQLEKSILVALGQTPQQNKMSAIRTARYTYSRAHSKYAGVRAYGRWREGQMHGHCYLEFPNGRCYLGEMRQGEIEGYGRMVIPSLGLYEGTFKSGKFHGHGVLEMKDNEVYEGNFRDGLFHGHGVLRSNYCTYVGEFQGNLKHGYGVLDDMISGDKYIGMFAQNKRAGPGMCITMDGDYFEGVFVNDELNSSGLAIFENGCYYEGELSLQGPNGKGTYYMPSGDPPTMSATMPLKSAEDDLALQCNNGASPNTHTFEDEDFWRLQFKGNILSGQLCGNWQEVRVTAGSVQLNKQFAKYPRSIGNLMTDNQRKWRPLFENFEEQLQNISSGSVGVSGGGGADVPAAYLNGTSTNSLNSRKLSASLAGANIMTKHLWNRIAVFMTIQRDRERAQEHAQRSPIVLGFPMACGGPQSNFERNISMGFWQSFDKLSLKSTSSLLTSVKSSILDLSGSQNGGVPADPRRSYSQETLYDASDMLGEFGVDLHNSNSFHSYHNGGSDEHSTSFSSFLSAQMDSWANDSGTVMVSSAAEQMRGSYESLAAGNGLNNNSFCSQKGLEFIPNFGLSPPLNEQDVLAIKEYLIQAFKDRHHPLFLLNQRIANCFYISYGCWKVKPSPILAKLAMREWESISKRVYKFVRKMFPALPEDYCIIESSREVVSHITLLYPIVLSEGIYSTLFVLYANKHSDKDEIYRQNLLIAEKLSDDDLASRMSLESSLLPVVRSTSFAEAIQTLKQLQEKYSPKAMLTVIENCMILITEATKADENHTLILAADSMMPLTLFLVLRAAVPHLGAELALLDDLTGGANFQFEMNGMAGYCYTTLKAAYEHIIAKPLK